MLKYRWVCHLCDEANTATNSVCMKCGFPAIASRLDIDRATGNAPSNDIEWGKITTQFSLPKKVAGGIAFGVLIVGTLLGKLAPPLWLNITGLALFGLGALALWALGFFGEDKS